MFFLNKVNNKKNKFRFNNDYTKTKKSRQTLIKFLEEQEQFIKEKQQIEMMAELLDKINPILKIGYIKWIIISNNVIRFLQVVLGFFKPITKIILIIFIFMLSLVVIHCLCSIFTTYYHLDKTICDNFLSIQECYNYFISFCNYFIIVLKWFLICIFATILLILFCLTPNKIIIKIANIFSKKDNEHK